MNRDERACWMLYGGGAKPRWRHVTPYASRIWFGALPQRRGRQWFIDVWDHEANAPRSFALRDIRRVQDEEPKR